MSSRRKLEVVSTGAPSLDNALGGGIPRGSVVVIAGAPGSGKTVLTMQMLFAAARAGKKCLYFTTLSEPAIKVIRYMQLFDFFESSLLDEKVIFADLGAAIREGADRTLAELERRVEEHEPDFVAFDSFRAIGEMLSSEGNTRPFIYDLAVKMSGWGATTLLVGEYGWGEISQLPEFGVADGIIRLGTERQELTSVREVEILKMRGAAYSSGRHFFDIDARGLSFFPRVSAPGELGGLVDVDLSQRVPTGVEGLDAMLGGGLPMGSNTVIQGGTGTGKTLLSLHFLAEGARRGEKGVYFLLEETPEQLRAVGRSVGIDVASLEEQGLLTIKYASPVELSTDRFLNEAREEVRRVGASRAVLDSLSSMKLGVSSERRFKELVYAVAKHLRREGVTLLMTVESEQLLGVTQIGGPGVSFVADNLLNLRYVEQEGRLEKSISVLKARGIRHETELRQLTIDEHGLHVSRLGFHRADGVLSGSRRLKERADE